MHLDIANLARTEVLAGAPQGRNLMLEMNRLAQASPARPTPWVWDCRGVVACSPSFGRESFIALQALLRGQRSTLWPVLANVEGDLREDFRVIWKEAETGIVTCRYDGGRTSEVALLGAVEPHLEATFVLVLARGVTDARELGETQKNEGIGQTAWNNRLAALAALGAVVEETAGRTKRYRPIVGEGSHGG